MSFPAPRLLDSRRANKFDRMIVVAVFCLAVAHPGPIFKDTPDVMTMGRRTAESKEEQAV